LPILAVVCATFKAFPISARISPLVPRLVSGLMRPTCVRRRALVLLGRTVPLALPSQTAVGATLAPLLALAPIRPVVDSVALLTLSAQSPSATLLLTARLVLPPTLPRPRPISVCGARPMPLRPARIQLSAALEVLVLPSPTAPMLTPVSLFLLATNAVPHPRDANGAKEVRARLAFVTMPLALALLKPLILALPPTLALRTPLVTLARPVLTPLVALALSASASPPTLVLLKPAPASRSTLLIAPSLLLFLPPILLVAVPVLSAPMASPLLLAAPISLLHQAALFPLVVLPQRLSFLLSPRVALVVCPPARQRQRRPSSSPRRLSLSLSPSSLSKPQVS